MYKPNTPSIWSRIRKIPTKAEVEESPPPRESKVIWSQVSYLRQDTMTSGITRAGVIPYTIDGHNLYLCLSLDRVHQELGDFGGGFSRKRDIYPERRAVIELKEESLGVFDFRVDQIRSCPVIYNSEMMIVFLYVDPETARNSRPEFLKRVSSYPNYQELEVSDIGWYTPSILNGHILQSGVVFDKVADMLRPVMFNLESNLKQIQQ